MITETGRPKKKWRRTSDTLSVLHINRIGRYEVHQINPIPTPVRISSYAFMRDGG